MASQDDSVLAFVEDVGPDTQRSDYEHDEFTFSSQGMTSDGYSSQSQRVCVHAWAHCAVSADGVCRA